MKNDFIHFVAIPFTGLGLHGGYRGDKWFKHRIELFKNYTLKSLLNQTNRQFIIWLCFRPEEKDNPITLEFADYMFKVKQPCIFTFHGIPIWDDKFKYDNLLERLEKTLPELAEFIEGRKYVYETCQPSDDLYHYDTIKEVNKQEFNDRRALTHFRGFLFNKQTKRLADWNPTTINPPFYTIMYPADVFLDPQKHFDYMRDSKSHEDIVRKFNCLQLPDYRYCVMVHEKNISTNWWHPFRGKVYSWKKGREIMKDSFGIDIGGTSDIQGGVRETKLAIRRLIFRFLLKIGFYQYAKRARDYIHNAD